MVVGKNVVLISPLFKQPTQIVKFYFYNGVDLVICRSLANRVSLSLSIYLFYTPYLLISKKSGDPRQRPRKREPPLFKTDRYDKKLSVPNLFFIYLPLHKLCYFVKGNISFVIIHRTKHTGNY